MIFSEGNHPGDVAVVTYKELLRLVCRFANVLKKNGIKKGDCVLISMPMVLEAIVGMLACARIGAVHTVVVCVPFTI
jgi:acetyl-CoA synthetase